ncbi:MAG TPA: hypothetical protein EYQ42_12065 [Thiotrichaceae bacterium]|jgi:hypothetical protein|nr:hypothetical protein [Thiotrichaceae bacterium]
MLSELPFHVKKGVIDMLEIDKQAVKDLIYLRDKGLSEFRLDVLHHSKEQLTYKSHIEYWSDSYYRHGERNLGVSGGYSGLSNYDVQSGRSSKAEIKRVSFDDTLSISGRAGVRFQNGLRSELDFGWQNYNIDEITSSGNTTSESHNPLMN